MPDVKADTSAILSLHGRCKAFRCLPYAGGMMDQPLRLMRLFDVIESRIAAHKRDQMDDLKREQDKQQRFRS